MANDALFLFLQSFIGRCIIRRLQDTPMRNWLVFVASDYLADFTKKFASLQALTCALPQRTLSASEEEAYTSVRISK